MGDTGAAKRNKSTGRTPERIMREITSEVEEMEPEAFRQSDLIRDYVFPLCTAVADPAGGWKFQSFLGTGFLIGGRGYALTAAHVLHGQTGGPLVAIFAHQSGGWWATAVHEYSLHEREDVALLRLAGSPWRSSFRLSNTWEGSSLNYQMWGYPDDVANEIVEGGSAVYRPDLVYAQGYIRRRIAHELPSIRGTQLFEVSEVVGQGCSGSPLYVSRDRIWDVVGIYTGELITDRGTSRAFAIREDAFRDWQPSILDCSVLEESQDVTPDL
jgi:hypothetical protein